MFALSNPQLSLRESFMNRILQVKPSIVFLFVIGPFILSFFVSIFTLENRSIINMIIDYTANMSSMLIVLYWFYVVGSNLFLLIKDNSFLKIKTFKLNLIFTSCYLISFSIFNILHKSDFAFFNEVPLYLLFPLHFYAILNVV